MNEKIISIESINPLELYGTNDAKLGLIKKAFPKLKIIARGGNIKVIGNNSDIHKFDVKLNLLIAHFHKYGSLTENNIERLLGIEGESLMQTSNDSNDILVFGNGGLTIKARTLNQRKMVEAVDKNDMVFCIGPAGTGKTYTAVALAVRALKNKEVKRIILTRPAVEAGENLGFLPGDLKEKLDPYLQPLYDALFDMVPAEKLEYFIDTKVIQIAPLAFMRGRTLDNAFVILDEAQNATASQMKMFLTRMGKSAKFVVTGDVTQIDLPKHQPSGLIESIRILKGSEGISFVYLNEKDVIRHKLVRTIIEAYNKSEKKKE